MHGDMQYPTLPRSGGVMVARNRNWTVKKRNVGISVSSQSLPAYIAFVIPLLEAAGWVCPGERGNTQAGNFPSSAKEHIADAEAVGATLSLRDPEPTRSAAACLGRRVALAPAPLTIPTIPPLSAHAAGLQCAADD